MKAIRPVLFATLAVLLFSCKHETPEKQPDTSIDSGPTDTSQISKNYLGNTVLTSGTDQTKSACRYDAQNRLSWYSNTSTKKDFAGDTSKIVRDGNGIIQKIVYRSKASGKYPDPKLDSVEYTVSYNAAASRYTHKMLKYKSYGVNFKDSFAYAYDAQNHILKEDAYYFDYMKTKRYVPYAKTDLSYDAKGAVTSLKIIYYEVDGVNDYPFEITYTYEDKGVNLLNLGNEAIILGLQKHFSAHLPKTMTSTYPLDPQYNRSYTYKYTFNTKYRPLTAEISEAVTGVKSTLVYTYQ